MNLWRIYEGKRQFQGEEEKKSRLLGFTRVKRRVLKNTTVQIYIDRPLYSSTVHVYSSTEYFHLLTRVKVEVY